MPPPEPFRPLPLLSNPHAQTILAKLSFSLGPPSETVHVALDDGDVLALEVSTPEGWTPDQPTVVMVHGLTGSHKSVYMRRMASKLYRDGVRGVRMNLRGCGTGAGLARLPYYAGCGHDVLAVIQHMRAQDQEPGPYVLVGFSLGGNIVLDLAAKLGTEGSRYVDEVVTFSPAVDLAAAWVRLQQPACALYHKVFVNDLRGELSARRKAFPDMKLPTIPRGWGLKDIDQAYVAPTWGFTDADDYYEKTSVKKRVTKIDVPCRIVIAEDDPIIDHDVLTDQPLPSNIEMIRPPHGGHLGFLGRFGEEGIQWMDRMLLRWIKGRAAPAPSSAPR